MAIGAKIIGQALIERALLDAFEQWTDQDVNKDHWAEQFRELIWEYENVTVRKSGEIVGPEDRNIYDLGELYESGVRSYSFSSFSNGAKASWHWDATNSSGEQYAWYVHEGKSTNLQPRPFTDDIAIASSFFLKGPGMALQRRVQQYLLSLRA